MKHMIAVMYVMMAIVLIVGTWIIITLKRENNRLEPKAKKYDEICSGVKAALWVDRTLLHGPEESDWMAVTAKEIEDDRQMLFRKLGATIGGDDSYVMLQRCLPQPFPMDTWRGCIATNDNVCLRALLQQAHDAIP